MTVARVLLLKELRFWFRRPGVHLFAALFGALGMLTMLAMGGDFEFIQVGGMGGLRKADSPNQLINLTLVFGLFATMNIAAAAGGAATRDVTEGMHPLVFSTPVPKSTFLLTRFAGALAVSSYLVAAVPLGLFLGTFLPGLEAERIGAFAPGATLLGLAAWVTPNVWFTTALFFAIGALTRRMFPIYIGGIFLFVGYLGASAFLDDLDNRGIAVMLDPFGMTAIGEVVRYWTPVERNTLLPLPTGLALVNRVLWGGLGVMSLVVALWATRLDQYGWQPFARFRRTPVAPPDTGDVSHAVPATTRQFDAGARMSMWVRVARRALLDVIGHRYFWAFVGAAVLFELLNAQAIGTMYGTDTWPVTYQVLEVFEGTLGLFLLVILTFYAGDLVWHERDLGQDQLLDSTPMPEWVPLVAKYAALCLVVVGLHATVLVLGPLVQLGSGYTHLELPLYLQALFGLSLLDWLPLIALTLAIHVVVNNKVAGHAVVVGFWVLTIFRSQLGFEHNLFWPGSDPGRTYSDMNAWGFSLAPFMVYKTYWVAMGLFLLGLARLAWVRGTDNAPRVRLTEARRRLTRPMRGYLGLTGAATATLALLIFVQTNVVHGYETTVDEMREQVAYEQGYKAQWEGAPHPIVTAVDARVDLYPEQGRADVHASLDLVNPHDVPIAQMLVTFPDDEDVRSVSMSVPFTETWDTDLDVRTWTVDPPLLPGQTATLRFEVQYQSEGMANSGFETSVVANGTFLHQFEVFPVLGYERGPELSDPADRRKYDLPERDRMRDLDDPLARLHNALTDDGHRVDVTVRLSTVAGQIPLAPGRVIDEGSDGGRVWRTYRTDDPILYFLAFLSGDWEVTTADAGGTPIEVYSHPEHPYNVHRMIEGMTQSLAMFQRDFGPFQYHTLRIVEFPRYANYAQSFPTLVPFSESIGFVARLTDPDEDIDYPFYVTAHEVAHQWWAHQIVGGDGQGTTLLTESLSQYSALKVMEDEFGADHIQRFLEYESDRYFRGRGNERDEEMPLMRVENQQYIHYQKGGIVLYTLADRVGTAAFDQAIRSFLETWRYGGPPYPNARDFVDHLKQRFPEHEGAISDGFERIVLYDLRLVSASSEPADKGWTLQLDLVAKKLVADGEGRETEEPFTDDVVIEVTDTEGGTHTQVVSVRAGEAPQVPMPTLQFAPSEVRLDPRALYLERDRDDNSAPISDGD